MRAILILTIVCLALGPFTGTAAPMLEFKISRPYAVLNFLEAAKGVYGTSPALKQYIETRTATDTAFQRLVTEFIGINLDQSFQRDGFPKNRPSYRSTKDLIMIAAVQSNDMATFSKRIVGILHNTDHIRLLELMKRADPYYEKIIWKPYGQKAMLQLNAMKKFEPAANAAFTKLRRFYRSSWPDDMPFTVALVPIPGGSGGTSATPHANSLCVDILTEEKDHAMRVGIILHEICHVLYAEQGPAVQEELEGYFSRNGSQYAQVAHNFFDEGMATACGNGWTYTTVTGKLDTAGWYSNEYIDGFGHALYPAVTQYLRDGKSIDQAFVDGAVRSFGEKFPRSPFDYGIQFNHLTLYSDNEKDIERNRVRQAIYDHFSVYWLNFTTPVLGAESISFLKDSDGTQLILVDRDRETTFQKLKTILPDLARFTYDLDKNFVIDHLDGAKRLIVIANIKPGGEGEFFKAIQHRRYADPKEPYWLY